MRRMPWSTSTPKWDDNQQAAGEAHTKATRGLWKLSNMSRSAPDMRKDIEAADKLLAKEVTSTCYPPEQRCASETGEGYAATSAWLLEAEQAAEANELKRVDASLSACL